MKSVFQKFVFFAPLSGYQNKINKIVRGLHILNKEVVSECKFPLAIFLNKAS